MSAGPAPPRVHGPGLGWLPAVLRRRATWRTVWRFAWAGPLIGGLPYAWTVVGIPFAYLIGAVPATVAGLLFAVWYHAGGRVPSWPWRAVVGSLAGLGGSLVVALGMLPYGSGIEAFHVAVVAAHGVPAALVLGLLQKPVQRAAGAPACRTPVLPLRG
ncbi:MAG: hypothetical protein JNM26_09065 [Ideonella sp.]|nr:hypothetical protein [Ideonella sp.]